MKKNLLSITIVTMLLVGSVHAATITYTYESQHRLVSADYWAAQADTHMTYQYDAANNIDLIVAITDSQWLRSFQLWLSSLIRRTTAHS